MALTKSKIPHDTVLEFILAGRANFTARSLRTGNHITYRVKKTRRPDSYIVQAKVGTHFKRVGWISARTRRPYFNVSTVRIPRGHEAVRGFQWMWRKATCGRLPESLTRS